MDKYKSLSILLLGIVIGMGYSTACSSDSNGGNAAMPNIPGVGVAMAQDSNCAQWEIASFSMRDDTVGDESTVLPPGFAPLGGIEYIVSPSRITKAFAARCAQ